MIKQNLPVRKKPYISFVVTARNDDYGGNWQNRINAFMKVLAYQANRTKVLSELVFVEYNPVQNKKFLYEELVVPKNDFFKVRFIVVPPEFHKLLPDHEKVSVCEFIGKNIGIRRATGEFICGTNPDVIYGNDLFDFFKSKTLENNKFYRIDRRDISPLNFNSIIDAEEILAKANSKIIKIMYNDHTEYVSWKEWLNTLVHGRTLHVLSQCPIFNTFRKKSLSKIHENAAGDFLLTHRNNWEKIRGYDERTVGSGVLDSYAMYVLYCQSLSQEILPYSLYHMYHHHGGVVYLASHKQMREDAEKMLMTKIPYKINSSDWGFVHNIFAEIVK